MTLKPMLATDADESKIIFPVWAQPKIDGVRALNLHGALTGRSLKSHRNSYTTSFWSVPSMLGIDGELAAEKETHPDLCRITSSAVSTGEGAPFTLWWAFDLVTEETYQLPYHERYRRLKLRLNSLLSYDPVHAKRMRLVPSFECPNMEQLLDYETQWLDAGYEGVILRDPNGRHKNGRSTVREGGLLRIKRFIEEEAVVLRVEEGESNQNEATLNLLGKTERSSHQQNMIPNGQVGRLICGILKDIHDPQTNKLLFTKGHEITVSPGNMDRNDRRMYFDRPELILKEIIKFKFFPKGVKDKPRFPTFVCVKAKSDLP